METKKVITWGKLQKAFWASLKLTIIFAVIFILIFQQF